MEQTNPKAFVFVLMPFAEEFNDVYKVGIKAACKDAGAYCERVDEQIFVENILERVYNQIAKADLIVAEMTGRNPNVFYETGYAHALNKPVILLTKDEEDIPFDLKPYPHIVYGQSLAYLKDELEKRVRWSIENPRNSLSNVDFSLEVATNGQLLDNTPTIQLSNPNSISEISISVHNITTKSIKPESYNVDLFLPREIEIKRATGSEISDLPEGKKLCNFIPARTLFPNGWHTFYLSFIPAKMLPEGHIFDMNLRLSTEVGIRDYPFKLSYRETFKESED